MNEQQKIFKKVTVSSVAGYWNNRPCNVRHTTAEIGTKQYFDEVEARKYFVEPHIPGFAEFEKWNGKKVLEIGCGIGTDTINFARAGAKVTAVDLSSESLKLARKRAEVMGVSDQVTFYEANAEELSKVVPPEPYDLIYSFGVIHHTPYPENVIKQIIQNYVKEGTVFKIMVYNLYSTKVLRIILKEGNGNFGRAEKLVAINSEAQTGCPVTYTYTKYTLPELIKPFSITEIHTDHIFPFIIKDYVKYKYTKILIYRWMPSFVFRFLERNFGWHLCATAVFKNKL